MKSSAIAIMAKQPIPGQVKTRLCPPLSFVQAAALYAACCRDVIENALTLDSAQTVIAATPVDSAGYFKSIAPSADIWPVEAETIGGCLLQVMTKLFESGYPRVLAVSSDSPDLSPEIMQFGLERLASHDLVLGPAHDGGYYLIGLKRIHPQLFSNRIDWSTDKVLSQTLTIAGQLGLSYTLLSQTVTDVDEAEDLDRLSRSLAALQPHIARHTRQMMHTIDVTSGGPK